MNSSTQCIRVWIEIHAENTSVKYREVSTRLLRRRIPYRALVNFATGRQNNRTTKHKNEEDADLTGVFTLMHMNFGVRFAAVKRVRYPGLEIADRQVVPFLSPRLKVPQIPFRPRCRRGRLGYQQQQRQ